MSIYYASCRADHGGTIRFAKTVNFQGPFYPEQFQGKRFLVIVHGTANTNAELQRLAMEIQSRNPGSFDHFVMFCWPGGATGLAYLLTRFTAIGRAARFLAEVIDRLWGYGAATIDIDAHSLGVPIALEAVRRFAFPAVDGLWLKAGACGRDLSKYRQAAKSVAVFYSPRDLILTGLYRIWFSFFGGALGAYGEKTKGGNVGVNYDVSPEIGGSHVDYRRSSIVVQAMRNEAERRRKELA